jgi:hypothetical protein
MHLHSIHIQRELTWLLDAIYKLSPEEFRPDGTSNTVHPKISVLKIGEGYAVSFVWDGAEAEFTIPDDKAMEMLRQKSRPLIDITLSAIHKEKSYVRRPLLIELQMVLELQGVHISKLRNGKLRCKPLLRFPWRSEHEFSCANDRDVKDALRINRMIMEGTVVASPFSASAFS